MDGRVLADLFSDEFRAAHPVADRAAASADESPEQASSADWQAPARPYSADEQEEIEDRLKALGYLD